MTPGTARSTYAVDKDLPYRYNTAFGLGAIPVQDANGNEITASPVLGIRRFDPHQPRAGQQRRLQQSGRSDQGVA